MNQTSETSRNAVAKPDKNIRCKTRQTCSAEEKIRTILAGPRGGESIYLLCRREDKHRHRRQERPSVFFMTANQTGDRTGAGPHLAS